MTSIGPHTDTGLHVFEWEELDFNQSWVKEAPLKLVASTLESMDNRTGKAGAIRGVLEDRVEFNPKWESWWKRVKPMLEESEHFSIGKSHAITLLDSVDDIPFRPLRNPVKKPGTPRKRTPPKQEREWLEWLTGELESPPPSRTPAKAADKAIAECPDKALGQALNRTSQAAEEFLDSYRTAPREAARWASLLSLASARWRDYAGSDSYGESPQSIGTLLARLITAAKFTQESRAWLRQAGDLSRDQPDAWRGIFATGLWKAFGYSRDGARDWFHRSFHQSVYEDRVAWAREIALGGLNVDDSSVRHIQLERLLELFSPADRTQVIQNIIVRSASGEAPRERVLDFVVHICRSGEWPAPVERLNLLVLAALLLSNGQGQVLSHASQEINAVLMDEPVHPDDSVWSSLLSAPRQWIADMQESWSDRFDKQRSCQDEEQARMLREKNELSKLVDGLRAEIGRNREQSKLEILKDPLMVIAENLQWIRQRRDNPEEMLRQAEAGLALALRTGGANGLGTVGETVDYEPSRHESVEDILVGSSVRIIEPGTIVPGKLTNDYVLIKALVAPAAEVE